MSQDKARDLAASMQDGGNKHLFSRSLLEGNPA